MADYKFDIGSLRSLGNLAISHGLQPKYVIADGNEEMAKIAFPDVQVINPDKADALSYLGTPVMFTMTFKGGNYKYYHQGELNVINLPDLTLPFSSMAEFAREKNLTVTATSGGFGSVKETMGHKDWSIRIKGMFSPEDYRFDEVSLKELLGFEELVDSIDVSGRMFEALGIYKLVIKGVNIGKREGYEALVPFELDCLSDEPVELILG